MIQRQADSEKIINLYTSNYLQDLTDEEKYRYLTQNDLDILAYKKRVAKIIQEKGLGSYMNDSKWLKLQKEMDNLEFSPAYFEKLVTDNEFRYANINTQNISFLGNWAPYYMEGMPLFFDIEYLILVPKRIQYVGRLVKAETIDSSENLREILIENNIPFETDNHNFVIYGYK